MLGLDAEMRERGYQVEINVNKNRYELYYWDSNKGEWTKETLADTMPEAVAKSAYKALTGEEWKGDA